VIPLLILRILAAPLKAIGSLLPNWDPVDLSGYGAWLSEHDPFSWFGWLNFYFPVADVLIIVGVLLTVGVALNAWHWVVWIGTKLHLFGGSSD
jgi:hypothetical protein